VVATSTDVPSRELQSGDDGEDDGREEEGAGEEEEGVVAQERHDDQHAVEFYRYQPGDLVLVSTEHVERKYKEGKKLIKRRYCDASRKFKSIAKQIGPFEVVEVREGGGGVLGGENRMPKYRLKVPVLMQLVSSLVDPRALQIFKTRAQLLSAPCKTRTMARVEGAEMKMAQEEGAHLIEWVLDIQEETVADKKKPVRKALVAWKGHGILKRISL
jgi:hypothetical protein